MTPAPRTQKLRVFDAIAEGCETTREVSLETGLGLKHCSHYLAELVREGSLRREAKPTFFHHDEARPSFRYRLVFAEKALA